MARIFKTPFGAQGDTEQVPEAPQGDGSVSLTQGFGYDYEREYEDPAAKDIRREVMNGLFHDITEAIGDIQLSGIAKWDAAAAPYPAGAVVWHDSVAWRSTSGNNNDEPGSGGWRPINAEATETEAGISAIATQAEVDAGDDDAKFVTALKLKNRLDQISVWSSKAIAEPFPIFDHLPGIEIPPTNNPNFRFIKLTAGENGAGGYNEGVLVGETVSGSAPLVVATAVIDYADSPINGETINLINTEGHYVKPGTSSGTLADDQMQQITGEFGASRSQGDSPILNHYQGAFSSDGTGSDSVSYDGFQTNSTQVVIFDSANSPNARTGDYTDVRHQQATYFMRIA